MVETIKFLNAKQIFESIDELSSNAKNRVYVAVAFVGKKGMNFLENIQNVKDVKMIINFSESSVKNGLTNPGFVVKFKENKDMGKVRNCEKLHAKMYVFDDTALICSANLSLHAETENIEAGVLINKKEIVDEIVNFFELLWENSEEINHGIFLDRLKIWNKYGNKRAIQMKPANMDIKRRIKPWKSYVPPTLKIKLKDLLYIKDKEYFYIMHLSYNGDMKEELWDYAKDNNIIGLSHQEVDDWATEREFIINEKRLNRGWINQFNMFCYDMNNGDIVLILDGEKYLLGIAEIDSECKVNENIRDEFFDHVRKVKWIEKLEYDERRKLPVQVGFKNTLNKVKPGNIRWEKLKNLTISANFDT